MPIIENPKRLQELSLQEIVAHCEQMRPWDGEPQDCYKCIETNKQLYHFCNDNFSRCPISWGIKPEPHIEEFQPLPLRKYAVYEPRMEIYWATAVPCKVVLRCSFCGEELSEIACAPRGVPEAKIAVLERVENYCPKCGAKIRRGEQK